MTTQTISPISVSTPDINQTFQVGQLARLMNDIHLTSPDHDPKVLSAGTIIQLRSKDGDVFTATELLGDQVFTVNASELGHILHMDRTVAIQETIKLRWNRMEVNLSAYIQDGAIVLYQEGNRDHILAAFKPA